MEDILKKILFDPTLGKWITIIIGILIIISIVKFLQRSLSKYVKDADNRYRARKFIAFIGYIISVLVITIVFSDKLGGLTVALGVAGAGIAFALQEVIVSIAGWFAITFAHYFKTGDRVKLGGIKGDVIDIGILRSTIMEVGDWVNGDLYNGRVVRMANSFVFKEPVFNYSGEFPFLWDEITIPIRYGSDVQATRELLNQISKEIVGEYAEFAKKAWQELVNKYLIENEKVEPMITLTTDENWITFTLRYVVDYKKRRLTKDQLYSRILADIESSEGKISIASTAAEINLVGAPPFQVKVNQTSK